MYGFSATSAPRQTLRVPSPVQHMYQDSRAVATFLTLLKKLRSVAPIQVEGDKQCYFMPCVIAHVEASPHAQ